ncbi:MAG: hypothetical protein D6714_20910 [Bacteroidetes bacterium]|nr:MAG: hypothetical protein D6714_20910 [Bacteroidota bacterium]
MKNYPFLFFALSLFLALPGCVSKKKFVELEVERNYFKDKYDELREVQTENESLQEELRTAKAELRQTTRDLEQLTVKTEQLARDNDRLAKLYDELLKENKELLSTSSVEKLTLEEQLAKKQIELNQKQRELEGLEYALSQREGSLEELRQDLIAREQRVQELENLLRAKDEQMTQLRNSLQSVLRGFSDAELNIAERNGKLYISLSSDLLFKTGSDKIDWKGKNALKQLAEAMNQNADFSIAVEGHTDNTGDPKFNWDLSAKRATAVVKILADNGVDPSRMVACGRGLYAPLYPNDTEANRAKNRRTEIILSPPLDKLYEIIKN